MYLDVPIKCLLLKQLKKRVKYINRKIDPNHVTFYKVYPLLNCSTRLVCTQFSYAYVCNTMTNAGQYCEI